VLQRKAPLNGRRAVLKTVVCGHSPAEGFDSSAFLQHFWNFYIDFYIDSMYSSGMRIANNLEVTFHRTVRVKDGRTPANLPPSLGRMALYSVAKYRKNCPDDWADDACFMALHDHEAMWMSFSVSGRPVALLVGAGGINALTGEKLGTVLAKDNYLVAPPQPWLDGWKDQDGTVYQFVATPYQKGNGITVAEQLIGEESKTGALGIAVFDVTDGATLKGYHSYPGEVYGGGAYDSMVQSSCYAKSHGTKPQLTASLNGPVKRALGPTRSAVMDCEMGIGRGGKIFQKIYPDPHGLEVWQPKPTAVFAVYLVNAQVAEEITGEKVANPSSQETYAGNWFELKDQELGDVAGSGKFSGLKSAAFPGDTANVKEEKEVTEHQSVAGESVSTWERGAHAPSGLALNALRAVFPGETLFEEVGALLEGSVSLAGTNCLESSRHGDEP